MSVAGVAMAVGMGMTGMTVVMIMGMVGHPLHSTRSKPTMQPRPVLITHYDTLTPRID
ncbi:MAG TPA: hypothetical protein VJO16_00820 [Candidatus Acidoferrum sp.]|nr:hypothetical protein [Candidatus Acidoferrum sp.]